MAGPPPPPLPQQLFMPPPPVPAAILPAPVPANGSLPFFATLINTTNAYLSVYDARTLFMRAMKVFYVSYPEIQNNLTQIQQDMWEEYMEVLADLHNLDPANDPSLYNIPYNQSHMEEVTIEIKIKQINDIHLITNPRAVVSRDGQQLGVIHINVHPYNRVELVVSNQDFEDLRSDDTENFTISLEGDQWAHPGQLNEFDFRFAQSSPEGYEDWFDFGRRVSLLIGVDYYVANEQNVNPQDAADFHVHTLSRMLAVRLYQYGHRTRWQDTGHQQTALQYKISCERPFVDPDTEDMYWTSPQSQFMQNILVPDLKPQMVRRRSVKYTDIQTYFKSDELEDRVCLCNEWCNWNAFFYHNPVYRFIMVRHQQLFMGENYNLPDIYLLTSVMAGLYPPNDYPKLPVLRLIHDANEYRNRYYLKVRASPNLWNLYEISYPDPRLMNAVSYNTLRYALPLQELCFQLDINPFADNCIEGLINYYKVMSDLHLYCSSIHWLVNQLHTQKKLWFNDYELVSRNGYQNYIRDGYYQFAYRNTTDSDYLFSLDYEYAFKIVTTPQEIQIKRERDRVLVKSLNDSPLNVKGNFNQFLTIFYSMYKFIAKVEPMLSVPHKRQTRDAAFLCYQLMDEEFNDFKVSGQNFTLAVSGSSQFNANLEQHFYVFFTLKLYFYAFEIQKQCIKYGLLNNRSYRKPVAYEFYFIWGNQLIEQTYANNNYSPEVFPVILNTAFDPEFVEFYNNFYGAPFHEGIADVDIPLTPLDTYIDCVFEQHRKLSVWLRHNGNNLRKFTNIIGSVITLLDNIRNHSSVVLDNWILPAIAPLYQNDHPSTYETYDLLVYYLVKANCSVILDAVGVFLQNLNGMQNSALTLESLSFSLSKPGWIPLIRVMDLFRNSVDYIQTLNIEFDDENDRIVKTCLQTKRMIRELFRQLYGKLCSEWLEETIKVGTAAAYGQVTINNDTITFFFLQCVVSLPFILHFINEFREEVRYYSKKYRWYFAYNPCPQLLTPDMYQGILYYLDNYFRDVNAIRVALPYEPDNIWAGHPTLQYFKNLLAQETAQAHYIDLNVANQ